MIALITATLIIAVAAFDTTIARARTLGTIAPKHYSLTMLVLRLALGWPLAIVIVIRLWPVTGALALAAPIIGMISGGAVAGLIIARASRNHEKPQPTSVIAAMAAALPFIIIAVSWLFLQKIT